VSRQSPTPPPEQGSARAQERVSASRRRRRYCLSGSLPAPFWRPGAWHNRPSCGDQISQKAAGTGPGCSRLMPVRAKANRPSRAIRHRRKVARPRPVQHNQLQRLRSTVLPLRGGSSTARRTPLALAENTSSFCLHPLLGRPRRGCEPSWDEKIDLNITCENYVMFRGVNQSSPR
jgi:hypothetical protein